jgi:hypothetical protein
MSGQTNHQRRNAMKSTAVLVGMLVILATMGFTCINDNVNVPLDVPLERAFDINGGTNTNFSGVKTVTIDDEVDVSWHGAIGGARLVDIVVWVTGPYSGNVVGGVATINNQPILTFAGPWSSFQKEQSLLKNSKNPNALVKRVPAGTQELVKVLFTFVKNQNVDPVLPTTVTFAASGSLSQGPVPNGLQVHVKVKTQCDANISKMHHH